jgi:hypothetical protein
MSSERPEESSDPSTGIVRQTFDDSRDGQIAHDHGPSETEPKSASKDREKPPRNEVSEAKIRMQTRLPALDDDPDVGVQKEIVVTRDGKPDLAFTGTLLASAAPSSAPK